MGADVTFGTGGLVDGGRVVTWVSFSVGVLPVAQGRMTPVVSNTTGRPFAKHTNASALAQYRADVQQGWDAAMEHVASECNEPVAWLLREGFSVRISYVFPRPSSHLTSKDALTKSAPRIHIQKPDVDKLARATLDALTGYAWRDDSQVHSLHVTKHWGDRANVRINIGI